MQVGEWWHSIDHDEPCRVVDTETLWGQASCLVWLPRRDSAVRVLQKRLVPLRAGESQLLDRLSYVSAAARIVDALERDALVAPLEGTVIPLPHQLLALQRAISGDRIRYLLADEVGLGKTIEAGLVVQELLLRHRARTAQVVCPASLQIQWRDEMREKFGLEFRIVDR
jgi:SNF2 family DNA or RNA helicase